MYRVLTLLMISLVVLSFASADDGLFDNGVSTVHGDVLEARGELAESLGKGALLRSMSAEQLQEAIEKRLSNRKERVEQYYELRDLRDEEQDEDRISDSQRRRILESQAPDRLNKTQIDMKTGEIYWPSPLDSPVLKPYRKPIEDTLDKRGQKDAVYRKFDYLKVHRMVKRIREAVESIEDKLDAREVVALMAYLDQIDYEARFDASGDRVDLK